MKFIAQSTDNEASMFIAENRDVLPDEDQRRQFIASEISAVLGRGSTTSVGLTTSLHWHAGKVAIKVIPQKRDEANRLAPLVAVFSLNEISNVQWPETVVSGFKWFGELVGRPLDNERLKEIQTASHMIKKKVSGRRKLRCVLFIVTTIAAGSVTAFLFLYATKFIK